MVCVNYFCGIVGMGRGGRGQNITLLKWLNFTSCCNLYINHKSQLSINFDIEMVLKFLWGFAKSLGLKNKLFYMHKFHNMMSPTFSIVLLVDLINSGVTVFKFKCISSLKKTKTAELPGLRPGSHDLGKDTPFPKPVPIPCPPPVIRTSYSTPHNCPPPSQLPESVPVEERC